MIEMNIEILGITTHNKGAMLMLEAVLDRVRSAFPEARIGIPAIFPAAEREKYNLYATWPRERGKFDASFAVELIPTFIRKPVKLMARSEVDVILDVSGFAYGDYWAPRLMARRLTDTLPKWRTGNKAAILLPQAFGPFKSDGRAEDFRKVLDNSDLVYVRDRASMVYVNEVAPGHPAVRAAPDFTNLLHPELPVGYRPLTNTALITPNQKMTSRSSVEEKSLYIGFLARAVEKLRASGRTAMFLIHETSKDRAIADAVNERLAAPADILEEPSPLITKALIGTADLLVSSRFHALVSALSAGVPAMASGWSHKYAELMGDYDQSRFLIDYKMEADWDSEIDAFIEAADDRATRDALRRAGDLQRERSEAMWEEVIARMRRAG